GVRRGRERGAGEADDVHRVRDARHLERGVDRLAVDLVGARKRGARRQLSDDDQIPAVELWDESGRRLAELVETEREDARVGDQHDDREMDDASNDPAVAAAQSLEAAVEEGEEAADRPLPEAPPAPVPPL